MKLVTLTTEYKNTQVLKGSPVLYFVVFWKTKMLSFLQQRSPVLNTLIHKIVHVLPKPKFVIKNKTGVFLVEAFDDSTTICSDYFEAELRDWLATPPTKDVFFDIGANRGIYTVLALTKYRYQAVHAFEPNQEVVATLTENIALNELTKKTTVHPIAVGAEAGTTSFMVDPLHKGGGQVVADASTNSLLVTVHPLDTLLGGVLAKRVSFIKIDTEGFEFAVLEGMPQTLTGMPIGACLMIESTEPAKLTAILRPYGFQLLKQSNHDHLFQKHA